MQDIWVTLRQTPLIFWEGGEAFWREAYRDTNNWALQRIGLWVRTSVPTDRDLKLYSYHPLPPSWESPKRLFLNWVPLWDAGSHSGVDFAL